MPLLEHKSRQSWRQKIGDLRATLKTLGREDFFLANNEYGPLNYRTAARTPFLRPCLAQFCPVFRRFFAVFSVLTPGFQKVAPKDRGAVP